MVHARTAIACSALVTACGARSGLDLSEPRAAATTDCTASAPTCVKRSQWCEAPTIAAAICDTTTLAWSCPAGSSVYRSREPVGTCFPFSEDTRIAMINGWGLSGFTRLPTDDGRCLWIADSVTFPDDSVQRNVAFEADPDLAFGECPTVSMIEPRTIVTSSTSTMVEVNGGYRLGGVTHVLYRVFAVDSSSAVGAYEVNGGIARFDSESLTFDITSRLHPDPPWGLDLDLGDAYYPYGDGTHELIWGCAGEGQYLTEGCKLARVAADDTLELYSKAGDWIASVRASDGAPQFDSGTWQSSVVQKQSGFQHLYIPEYGTSIATQSAPTLLGPWSDEGAGASCDIAIGDSEAFCAAPVVHPDLIDPMRPDELPVTYAVGTTRASPISDEKSYWPRLVWLR